MRIFLVYCYRYIEVIVQEEGKEFIKDFVIWTAIKKKISRNFLVRLSKPKEPLLKIDEKITEEFIEELFKSGGHSEEVIRIVEL